MAKEVPEIYKKWVETEAAKINSDGCSVVSEWHQWCCFEHDLACHYGKDPREAIKVGWENAPKLSRRDADKRYAACNLAMSSPKKPWEYLRSVGRYIGVRLGSFWPF